MPMGHHTLNAHLIILKDVSEAVGLLLCAANQNDPKAHLQPLGDSLGKRSHGGPSSAAQLQGEVIVYSEQAGIMKRSGSDLFFAEGQLPEPYILKRPASLME